MRRRALVAITMTVAACWGRSKLETERPDTCDARGPHDGPRPDRLEETLARAVDRELFPDEKAVRERCRLERVSVIAGDDGLKTQCNTLALRQPSRDACRRACLVTGRAQLASALHDQVVHALEVIDDRFHDTRTCGVPLRARGGRVAGIEAAQLWRCLGNEPLPAQLALEIVVEAGSLERVRIDGPLVPNGGVYSFTWGKTDQGCGMVGRSVEVHPPRFE